MPETNPMQIDLRLVNPQGTGIEFQKDGTNPKVLEDGVEVARLVDDRSLSTLVTGSPVLASSARPSYMTRSLPVDFNILRTGTRFETDIDLQLESAKPTGKEYFIDTENGSNSNNGLGKNSAFQTFKHAYDLGDGVIFNITTGSGYMKRIWWDESLNRNITSDIYIRGYGDTKPRIILGDIPGADGNPDWAKEAGYTNVYSIKTDGTLLEAQKLLDPYHRDSDGDPLEYDLVADIATVDSTPGSFYKNGQEFYVHGFGSEVISGDMAMPLFGNHPVIQSIGNVSGVTVFAENLELIGGQANIAVTCTSVTNPEDTLLVTVDCDLHSCSGDNNLSNTGFNSYCVRTTGSKSGDRDVFNYHGDSSNNYSGVAVEIDCIGRNPSNFEQGVTDNCSTGHEDYEIYRIEGSYYNSSGPTVIDVNTCRSWILGGFSVDSLQSQTIFAGGTSEITIESVIGDQKANWTKDASATLTIIDTNDNYIKKQINPVEYIK